MKILLATPVTSNKQFAEWESVIERRAGVPIVSLWRDNTGTRFIDFHNEMVLTQEFDWYIWGMEDYYPARDFVKIALETANKTGKRFIMLNDGKNPVGPRNASAAMVHKSYIKQLYGTGQLFWNEYRHHGCDSEITEIAKRDGELVYEERAIYLEVDIDKEAGRKPQTTEKDLNLYYSRKAKGFQVTEIGLLTKEKYGK
jgi:hypothetical protein